MSTRCFNRAPCASQSATGSLPVIRDAAKIASHNFATACSTGSPGNTSFAHSGVAAATIVQLISCRVINSMAGFDAFDAATFARATFAGSCPPSSAGFVPAIAIRAAPFLNASAIASCSQTGA